MPICPWPQLIVFSFGAGSTLLIASLIGAVAYNGKFGDDNKFRKYSYGWDEKFGKLCVGTVSCAMFTIALVMISILFNIKHLPKPAQIVFWVLADVAFIGTIACQGLSIEWSKYGEFWIPSRYDYINDKKFSEFVNNYYPDDPKDFVYCNETFNEGCNETLKAYDLLTPEHMPYFFAKYSLNETDENVHIVPQCVIEWDKATPIGIDPCNWAIEDGKCIGGWSPKKFKNYWCYAFRHNRTQTNNLKDKNEYEREKYFAEKDRAHVSVDSYDAFFEINNIFIGLECSGFGLTTLSLLFLLFVNPFDKSKIHYKEIEASGSGSASVKKTWKGGSSSGSGK